MNRLLLAMVVLVAALAAGCGTPCGPSNCAGCCDPHGTCQATANDACGVGGTVCAVCTAVQSCVEGACQFESGAPTTSSGAATTSSTSASSTGNTTQGNTSSGNTSASMQTNSTGTSGATAQGTTVGTNSSSTGTVGPATTATATTTTATSTSSSSSGTTGSGLLPICSACTQLSQCESGFCNTSVQPGYCDTQNPCSAQGGAGQDCSPYSCGSAGDCICPQTGTSGSTGSSSCTVACTTDAQCQNSCPAVTNASNCCDASGVCYVSNTLTCPVPFDGGAGTTGY